ncbi:unnamed protein product [Brassica oleracea var. botrytis]
MPKMSDFQAGLFPARSPLLRESLLGFWTGTFDDMTRIEFTTACQDCCGLGFRLHVWLD